MQSWVLQIRDGDGKPQGPTQILIDGGMPSHGHGLPTSPQVTAYLGDGRFRIEGLEFNMPGQWVLVASVISPQSRWMLRFEMELPP